MLEAEHPLMRFVEGERAPSQLIARAFGKNVSGAFPRSSILGEAKPSLDCVHAKHDIKLDPSTGVTSGGSPLGSSMSVCEIKA